MSTSDNLRNILDQEIERLHSKALAQPLNDMDVKKLESLTRAWKTYNATQEEPKGSEDVDMSTEDLLAIAKTEL